MAGVEDFELTSIGNAYKFTPFIVISNAIWEG